MSLTTLSYGCGPRRRMLLSQCPGGTTLLLFHISALTLDPLWIISWNSVRSIRFVNTQHTFVIDNDVDSNDEIELMYPMCTYDKIEYDLPMIDDDLSNDDLLIISDDLP